MLCASKNPPKYPEPIVLKMLLTQAKSTKRKQTKKKWKEGKKNIETCAAFGIFGYAISAHFTPDHFW